MNSKKKVVGIVLMALVTGAGLGGGMYAINTPTRITPRAAVQVASPTMTVAAPVISPPPNDEISETIIVAAFGTADAALDLNQDGIVNTLDLMKFRQKTANRQ